MPDRYLSLTDAEAALAARGELRAIVRKIKPQPITDGTAWAIYWARQNSQGQYGPTAWGTNEQPPESILLHSPFGAPRTILHLKETHQRLQTWQENGQWFTDIVPKMHVGISPYWEYKATNESSWEGSWRSPIQMPRNAIRHHLTVKSVRAMQEKDINLNELPVSHGMEIVERYQYTDWLWYAELEAANG